MEFAWKKNATTIQEDFQKLDDATTKTDRIFTNLPIYHQMTRKSKSCDHALILLWDPSKFIDCVQSMFLLVKKNAMSIDEYEKFAELQADMIDSAQTMILEIMVKNFVVVQLNSFQSEFYSKECLDRSSTLCFRTNETLDGKRFER